MKSNRDATEAGFALVGAVACIFLFSLLALAILNWTKRSLVAGVSEVNAARAQGAVDAGLAMAVSALLTNDPARRWSLDGRRRTVRYGEFRLVIAVIDERGKVPLNLLEEDTAEALFEASGLTGESLRVARDSLLDWLDDDDEPRPDGAERGYYRALGIAPRNGPLQTTGELGRIRGIDAALVERARPLVTVDFGSGSFDPRFAQPLAIAIMSGKSELTADAIARAREEAGQVTALEFIDQASLIGRPMTVAVRATTDTAVQAEMQCVVELTGSRVRPYVVRNCG